MRKPTIWDSTRSDTNQSQKQARSLKKKKSDCTICVAKTKMSLFSDMQNAGFPMQRLPCKRFSTPLLYRKTRGSFCSEIIIYIKDHLAKAVLTRTKFLSK